MDKEHIKGAAQKAEGSIKDTVGKLTGNDKLRAEGLADKAEGSVRETAGDIKDGVRKASDALHR